MHVNEVGEEASTYENSCCRPADGLERSSSDSYPFFDDDVSCHVWTDVTEEFMNESKTITTGQLIHDAGFSLFDAMSAIELMDPKMDAGILSENVVKLDFESAVKAGRIKLSGMPPDELIPLMDATFSTLVSWFEGHSLAQTVFINFYMHKPNSIDDRLIRSFCQAVLKLINICYDIIRRANVFEDEDFQQMLYNFDLLDDISCPRIIGILKDADDECQKKIRTVRTRNDPTELSTIADFDAITARLRFLRYLIISLTALTAKEDPDHQNVPGPLPKKQNFEEAKKNLCAVGKLAAKGGGLNSGQMHPKLTK